MEVVLAGGCLLIKVELEAEELGGPNRYLVACQWNQVDFGRDAGGVKHAVALLVVHHDIINDDAVEESHIHSSHADFRAKLLGERRRDLIT